MSTKPSFSFCVDPDLESRAHPSNDSSGEGSKNRVDYTKRNVYSVGRHKGSGSSYVKLS